MSNLLSRLVSPTALLYVYVTLMQIAHGIYFAGKIDEPAALTLVYSVGLFVDHRLVVVERQSQTGRHMGLRHRVLPLNRVAAHHALLFIEDEAG